MPTETEIIRRLHNAADRIEVDMRCDDIVDARALVPIAQHRRQRGSRRSVAVLAASVFVVAASLVTVVVAFGASRHHDRTPVFQAPRQLPSSAPAPGAILPSVDQPPPGLGVFVAAYRDGGSRTGQWVSLAIARSTDAGYASPIVVSVFDGSSTILDGATPTVLGAQSFLLHESGDVNVVAQSGSPMKIATGSVDPQMLAQILVGTETQLTGGTHTLRIADMPPGYSAIVEPTLLARDIAGRRTLATSNGTLGIAEVSDQVNPLLAAAGSGADLRKVDVDGRAAWLGISRAHDPPVTFLIWSPQVGVVFEIDSNDGLRTEADLVALATRTTAIPAAEWEQTYR